MSDRVYELIARVIILLTAIPMHEAAHAWASLKLGDPTARNMGRLSLNPIRHFDLMGGLCLLLAGIGWAKPVPVDPRYYKNRKLGMALSSLAGPASNLVMGYLACVVYKVAAYASAVYGFEALRFASTVFLYMTVINVSLGIFNLLPVPPFDGSRILLLALPERAYFGLMRYERYIFIGMFALLMLGVLDRPLAFLNNGVLNTFDFLTGYVDRIALSLLT